MLTKYCLKLIKELANGLFLLYRIFAYLYVLSTNFPRNVGDIL